MTRKQLTPEELQARRDNTEMKNDETEEDKQNELLDGDILIKKRKITLFRFWPKDQLRNAWRNYITTVQEDENLNAAYLVVQVLDKVCEQFVFNCMKK